MHVPGLASLRWRLTLVITGLVLLCTAVSLTGAVLFLRQALTERETTAMHNTLSGVSGYLDTERADLLGMAHLVAQNPEVRHDLAVRNDDALVLKLAPYYADLSAEIVDVIDARGRVIVRMENTQSRGDSMGNLRAVQAALRGDDVVDVGKDPQVTEAAGGYDLRAIVPIEQGRTVIGAVIVGRQLDSIFAARLGHALNAEVNLISGATRTGSTLSNLSGAPNVGVSEPIAVLHRIGQDTPSIATVSTAHGAALSGIVPLEGDSGSPVGAVEIVRPLGPLYDLIRTLSWLLLLLGALVVAAGTVLALGVSRRLTARLLVLETTASRVATMAEGDAPLGKLRVVETVEGNDEVASLARSFVAMMEALDSQMSENAKLYEASQARVRELTGLAEVARLLTGVRSVNETLDALAERVCRLIGSGGAAIWLPGDGAVPALHGGWQIPPGYEPLVREIAMTLPGEEYEIPSQRALRTGEIVYRDLTREPDDYMVGPRGRVRQLLLDEGWRGATAIPLRLGNRIVGAMSYFSTSPQPLLRSELSLLTTIGDQVAVAIENARLAEEAKSRAALQAALEERRIGEEALRASELRYRTMIEQSPLGILVFAPDGTLAGANHASKQLFNLDAAVVGEFDILHSTVVERLGLAEPLRRVFAGEVVTIPPIRYELPNGEAFSSAPSYRWIQAMGYALRDEDGGVREVVLMHEDITDRVLAEEQIREKEAMLEQRVEERTHELRTLLEVSHNVASTLELRPLLGLILDQLQTVVSYSSAAILSVQGDEFVVLDRRMPPGSSEEVPDSYSLAGARTIVDVLGRREPVLVDDVRGDAPLAHSYRTSLGEHFDAAFAFERSLLIVPLLFKDRMIGALSLTHAAAGVYTPHHAELVSAMANQAAVAIENARFYEQAQEVAVLEERQRLARELHDSVSQALYGIALGTKTARTLLDRDPSKAADPLEYVLAQAHAGLTEMRALIFELRPEALESEGLAMALSKQADALRVRHGIDVSADLPSEPDAPMVVKEAVYRIAQEALHNTLKHARARHVDVRLAVVDGMLELEIADNGKGFEASGAFPGHLGLKTMRERALRLGGTFHVTTATGEGTHILVRVPLKSAVIAAR
jgi:PAS domain S-box-containing protein